MLTNYAASLPDDPLKIKLDSESSLLKHVQTLIAEKADVIGMYREAVSPGDIVLCIALCQTAMATYDVWAPEPVAAPEPAPAPKPAE